MHKSQIVKGRKDCLGSAIFPTLVCLAHPLTWGAVYETQACEDFQMVLVVKNLSASAGDVRDLG